MNKRGKKFFRTFSWIFLAIAFILVILFGLDNFISGADIIPPSITVTLPQNNTVSSSSSVAFLANLADDTGLLNSTFNLYYSNGVSYSTINNDYYSLYYYNFSSISTGYAHTCGILINGTAVCSGYNLYYALGDADSAAIKGLVFVNSSGNFSSLSGGYYYTCGILTNGSALCWGYNFYSQLGDGTTTNRGTPFPVSGDYNFSQIYSSAFSLDRTHTCGLLANGSALCWGSNAYGQVGDGTLLTKISPTPVSGNYNFSSISLGYSFTCGILTNGSTMCWGYNPNTGYFGNGSAGNSNVPVFVNSYNLSSISVGYTHTCGLLANGSALCWGENTNGQLGNGSTTNGNIPRPVSGNYNFSQISSGYLHTCGILTNGSTICWGYNFYGQLGDGTLTQRTSPVFVNYSYNFTNISAGGYHTCGLSVDRLLVCWGYNGFGQLGDVIGSNKVYPSFVAGGYNFSNISGKYYHTCGVLTSGSAMCWGKNTYGQLGEGTATQRDSPFLVSGNNNFSQMALGTSHTCGLLANGSALCWGRNINSQLGNLSTTNGNIPRPVSGNNTFSQIFSGDSHTCGLLANGSALCWGYNQFGQLGNGSTGSNGNIPKPISGDYNFSQMALGTSHTCGLLANGSALCWGRNFYGQLGNGSTVDGNIPRPVSGNNNFSQISCGESHTCGVLTNGSAMCWGYNFFAQLGDGTTTTPRTSPVFVNTNRNFSKVNAGYDFSCGILINGSAMCWGNNDNGQLGMGSIESNYDSTPIFVITNYSFVDIPPATDSVCSLLANGLAMCWGDNTYGQIGEGVANRRINSVVYYTSLIFTKAFNLLDGVYTWFMTVFDKYGNNYNTGNYTLIVNTAVVSSTPPEEQSGGSLPPQSSSENTIYVPAALNDNFWTETTIIPDSEWQQPAQPVLTNEQTPITEPEAQTLEQQLINELKTNPNAETQEITIKEITENISTGERVKVDVKNSSYYVGVANVSADSVIVQVSGSGGGGATQSLMRLGDIKKFDLNGDGLNDIKIEIVSLEPSTKAGIKISVVYNGLLNAKEIQQYNQNQKSNKLLIFAFIFIGVLIAITIYFRFRKYK